MSEAGVYEDRGHPDRFADIQSVQLYSGNNFY